MVWGSGTCQGVVWLIAISSKEAVGVEGEEDALTAWLGFGQSQTKSHGGFGFTHGDSRGYSGVSSRWDL